MKYRLILPFGLLALAGCQHYGSIARPLVEEAEALADKEQWRQAKARAQEAVKQDPGYAPAWDALARACGGGGEFEEELQAAREAVRLAPGNGRYQYALAYALGDLGRWEESMAPAKRAIELEPTYSKGFRNYAYTLNILNRQTEAAEFARRATELDPKDAGAFQLYGAILADLHRDELAIAALEKGRALSPDDVDILRTLGNAYTSIDQPGKGIPYLERAVAKLPNDVAVRYELMYAYEAGDMSSKAAAMREEILKTAREGVAAKPNDVQAQLNLGHAYSAGRLFAEARAAYSAALPLAKTPKETSDVYVGVGSASMNLLDAPAAIAAYSKLIELQPGNASHHRQLGQACFFNKEFEKARAELKKARELLGKDAHTAAYLLIWEALAARNGNDGAGATALVSQGMAEYKEWPGPVFSFLSGRMTAEELVKAAGSNRDRLTEAHGYAGYVTRDTDPPASREHLQWVLDHGTPTYIEYWLARSVLGK